MRRGYETIALVGWVTAGVLAAVIFAGVVTVGPTSRDFQQQDKGQDAQGEQTDAKHSSDAASAKKDEPPTREYQADCSKKEDADLCAQRRMAKSAEDQTRLNKIGLVLLFFTFVATVGAVLYARSAAKAARKTVRTMQDTARRELRAYVAGIPTRLVELTPTTNPRLTIEITNHGMTPAHRMNHAAVLLIETHPLPDNYPFPDVQAPDQRPSLVVLHPESSVPYVGYFTRSTPFTAEEITEIFRGRERGEGRRLYAFGQIDYVDAFNRPHWTRFCASYRARRDMAERAESEFWESVRDILWDDDGKGRWEAAGQHNKTDLD